MFCILDLECENEEYYGSISSPFNPNNYIVEAGWAIDNGAIQSIRFENRQQSETSDWLERALEGQKYLVAHNATFEIHWLWYFYRPTLQKFLANGGRILCTQYMEFLLSHQTHLYPSLEECALKYGGSHKLDEVKILWESGYKTSEIDPVLLHKYLTDDRIGDIANTRRVAFSQIPLLKEKGMWVMSLIRMDSLLFNALATFNGLYVDLEVARKQQAEQEARIAELQAEIAALLPNDLPKELDFSFTSPFHMSAFIFGGAVKYDKQVPYDPPKYEKIDAYEFVALDDGCGTKYYQPVDNVDPRYETDAYDITVYKAGKSKGEPKVFRIDSPVEKTRWGVAEYTFKGLIDINSLPAHVVDKYLGKRADFRQNRTLVCGTPVFSTSGDSLDLLAQYTEAAKPLKELKSLEKDTGTYYLRTDEKGKQSGMLQYVEPLDDRGGIIHHRLNNCATVTARLSGSNPNLQNLPRDGTSRVKAMFASRFSYLGRIIEVDYSALEVVSLASISGDKNLLDNLLAGTDMHCYRLAGALGEDYDSVYEKCHNKDHPDHKQYKQMRTDIKPKAFANQYGASAEGIAFATGSTVEEAEQFKQTELKLFPESSVFASEYVRPEVERTGLIEKLERELDPDTGIWKHYRRGYFQAKGGTCYSFRQKRQWSKELREYIYDYKDTEIANYWNQGEASFIVQAACGRVIRWFIANNFFDDKALPINTVHDAIYADVASEELAITVGTGIREIMESTPRWLTEAIPAYKEWGYSTTPFPAAAEFGLNMMDKVDIA